MCVMRGLRGLAGNRRGIADSDFLGRDLTDGTDSIFDSNADLRGIGKGYQIRVREVSAVRGCVYSAKSVRFAPIVPLIHQ
ncbi:MAG: hypothetical protein LBK61_09865 [Spirochaetaceae bacterium]|nr:hypothetical protein [Spirochaetaceae bacterium]